MTTETQDAGTVTTAAGETQATDTTQTAAVPEAKTTETTLAAKPSEVEVTYDFKAPEDMHLNEEAVTEFKTLAKELKLAPEAAQKVVDLNVKLEKARADAFVAQVSKWGDQVKADKELGTPENLAVAKKAIDDLGSPELRDLLNSTGMGNHPAVVKFALAVGKAISEDRIVSGRNGGNPAPRDHATILYGNNPN